MKTYSRAILPYYKIKKCFKQGLNHEFNISLEILIDQNLLEPRESSAELQVKLPCYALLMVYKPNKPTQKEEIGEKAHEYAKPIATIAKKSRCVRIAAGKPKQNQA